MTTPRRLADPRLDRLDQRITSTLAAIAVPALRLSLGFVFVWFGVLKFFEGVSAAEPLVTRTVEVLSFGLVSPEVALPVLAAWEVVIGIGLLTGWFLRVTLALLALQMVGALAPLVLFPDQVFSVPVIVPTLEGQYIIKNLVLIAAAMVVGATVRGGGMQPEPTPEGEADADRSPERGSEA